MVKLQVPIVSKILRDKKLLELHSITVFQQNVDDHIKLVNEKKLPI